VRQEEKKRRRTHLSDICNTYFDYEEDSAPRYSMPSNHMPGQGQGGGPAGYVSDQSDGEGEGEGDLNYSDDDTGSAPLLPPSNGPYSAPSNGVGAEGAGAGEGGHVSEDKNGSNGNRGDKPRKLNTEFKVHSTSKKRCSVSWSSPHIDTHTERDSVRKREMEMESVRDRVKERERDSVNRSSPPLSAPMSLSEAKGGKGSRGESKGEGEVKAVGFCFEGDSWDRSTFGDLRKKYSEGHTQREKEREREKHTWREDEKDGEKDSNTGNEGDKGYEKRTGRVVIEVEQTEKEVEAAGLCEDGDSAPDSIPPPNRLSTLPSPPHLPLLYKPRRSIDTTSHRTSTGSQSSSSSSSHLRQFRRTSGSSLLSFSRSPRHIPVIVPRKSLPPASVVDGRYINSRENEKEGSYESDSGSESDSDSGSDSDFNMATSVPPMGAVLPPTLRPFQSRPSLPPSKKHSSLSSPSKVTKPYYTYFARHFSPRLSLLFYLVLRAVCCAVLFCTPPQSTSLYYHFPLFLFTSLRTLFVFF
jgi:hypothetical protein